MPKPKPRHPLPPVVRRRRPKPSPKTKPSTQRDPNNPSTVVQRQRRDEEIRRR